MGSRAYAISLLFCALAVAGCRAKAGGPGGMRGGNVRTISLPTDEPPLPPGPGREAFYASCVGCHSSRYISNQPRLSRRAWSAEVAKMASVYGAPVSDAERSPIVDYLVSINGRDEEGGGSKE